MKKKISSIWLIFKFLLWITLFDSVLLLICFQLEDIIIYDINPFNFKYSFQVVIEMVILKSIFYTPILYFVFRKWYEEKKYKMGVVNCTSYTCMSVFYVVLFPFAKDFLFENFFFYSILTSFLSPILFFGGKKLFNSNSSNKTKSLVEDISEIELLPPKFKVNFDIESENEDSEKVL